MFGVGGHQSITILIDDLSENNTIQNVTAITVAHFIDKCLMPGPTGE
jgi:hypothetical protein